MAMSHRRHEGQGVVGLHDKTLPDVAARQGRLAGLVHGNAFRYFDHDSATWLILAAMIPNKDGPPALAWCLVPVRDVKVDHDSWNVSGLQGTGSKTVAITEPLFVPRHRVLPLGAIFSGKVPGADIPDNGQARFGYPTFGPTALVSPIVGMAQ